METIREKKRRYEDNQLRQGIINEVARFILKFADYSTTDTFHIPLEIMKSLMCGEIPEGK